MILFKYHNNRTQLQGM